ncbi:MAG TPA: hemerythrin domain-containing protein [Parafilimonas sp.]|nr:hemerythrin domain-containing protein [Parafilimonas sp.]
MTKHKPIKRDKAFVTLSKDHHFGLLLIWKIRQDLAANTSGKHISSYVLEFFRDNLQEHFKEEEEIVFSKLPCDDVLREQAEKEHKNIYALIESLRKNDSDKDLQKQFADSLEAHVRFEERVLFNHLQDVLKPEELEEIFKAIAAHDNPMKKGNLFGSLHKK